MLSYLPALYERSRVMQELLQAEGLEMDALRQAIDETLDQFFVRTASWSLDDWEAELGLTPAPTQPDSERRDRIVSRIRGFGTCTISVVKSVSEAYVFGSVEVTEQPALYQVTVKFIDQHGIPPNFGDLQAALRAVVPAHLEIVYSYTYMTWDQWDALGKTWDQTDALGLTWDEFDAYSP
jgi:hypothetical protein